MIEVVDISKSFDGKQILKDVSARFETGKTNLIIGQSGSGCCALRAGRYCLTVVILSR